MEVWFSILIFIAFVIILFNHFSGTKNLPPGPLKIPVINDLLWLFGSLSQLEPMLKSLHAKLGPMVTIHVGPISGIFISDRSIAHEALIQNGFLFADRSTKLVSNNQFNISSATYGPVSRFLRRNLTSTLKSTSNARQRVIDTLLNTLKEESKIGGEHVIIAWDHLQYAISCLLLSICFGDKIDQDQFREIHDVQMCYKSNLGRFNLLHIWPRLTKILLYRRWREFYRLRRDQENIFLPLINARRINIIKKKGDTLSYLDTLLNLVIPEKGKLEDGEIINLCSEFFTAGADTTSTALQWIMANLVKHQTIQEKLFMEIERVVVNGERLVKEGDLRKMPYLKAVILEGLRRHPPSHFVLPHKVSEDVVLRNYLVPEKFTVHFMVAEMGWDPNVWEDPMVFKPERFLNEEGISFDITGSKEIKMMPFGAGRRMCPAYSFAMLHLEYFVANLIWNFKWQAVDDVNLEEKLDFTVVMKNPLQAQISPRFDN